MSCGRAPPLEASDRRFTFRPAGKTGTTNDGADAWFIGFTQDIVAGVWMGTTSLRRSRQVRRAVCWPRRVDGVHVQVYRNRQEPKYWEMPSDIVSGAIDNNTHLLVLAVVPGHRRPRQILHSARAGRVVCDVQPQSVIVPARRGPIRPLPGHDGDTSRCVLLSIVSPSCQARHRQEFFIRGTEPVASLCDVQPQSVIVPGAAGPIRPVPGLPLDTSRRARDSAISPVAARVTHREFQIPCRNVRPRRVLRPIPVAARSLEGRHRHYRTS